MDDHALAADAGLAAILHPRRHRLLHCRIQIGRGHDDEGVGAAQFQHHLLERAARLLGHRPAGAFAAGQGDGGDPVVGNDARHRVGPDRQILEQSLRRAGHAHHLLHQRGDALHVAGMFEQPDIARQDAGGEEADHLPIGEIPRHHRQHRPDRQPDQIGLAARRQGDAAALQHGRTFLGIMAEGGDAFVDLRQRGFERLAHFQRRHAREPVAMVVIGVSERGQQGGALLHRRVPPGREGRRRPIERGIDLRLGQFLMSGDLFSGGGVDALHAWLRMR